MGLGELRPTEMNPLALRVVARFLERADLEPPLGYPGGPCFVVDRIEQEVRNPVVQEKLVEEVEHGQKVENPDAARVYSPRTEHGVGQIKQITLLPHAQYRMDLRGITVPQIRATLKSLVRQLGEWKAQKSPMYTQAMEAMTHGTYTWTDPKLGLTVAVHATGGSYVLVTTYWKGESDPPAPRTCP